MKKGMSLYLDIIRFAAAMMVFIEHFRERTSSGLSKFWTNHLFAYTHLFFTVRQPSSFSLSCPAL
jgi:peptidoglycan/LPS O-acetylase OafA/YrhL